MWCNYFISAEASYPLDSNCFNPFSRLHVSMNWWCCLFLYPIILVAISFADFIEYSCLACAWVIKWHLYKLILVGGFEILPVLVLVNPSSSSFSSLSSVLFDSSYELDVISSFSISLSSWSSSLLSISLIPAWFFKISCSSLGWTSSYSSCLSSSMSMSLSLVSSSLSYSSTYSTHGIQFES